MASVSTRFDKRLDRIVRRHDRMSNKGIVYRIQKDGLITARPRLVSTVSPLRGAMTLIIASMLFKAFLYGYLGGITYEGRLADLQSGNSFERAGAWILQADPVTVAIADAVKSYLPN